MDPWDSRPILIIRSGERPSAALSRLGLSGIFGLGVCSDLNAIMLDTRGEISRSCGGIDGDYLQQRPWCCWKLWELVAIEHDIVSGEVLVMSPQSAHFLHSSLSRACH